MKYCPICGQQVPDAALRCPACHADFAAVAPLTTPPVPQAPTQLSSAGWPLPPTHVAAVSDVPNADAQTSGTAIGSLICGILFLVLPAAIAAIILGHISQSQIRQSGGRLKGRGLATAGLILGYLGVAMIPLILIIAALAIPNLSRSRMAANEATAVNSLRTVNTGCVTYSTEFGSFPPSLDALGGEGSSAAPSATAAQLIDSALQSGAKNGYFFSYSASDKDTAGNFAAYTVTAIPITPGTTGLRYFFTDQTDVIRANSAGPADENSPPIE